MRAKPRLRVAIGLAIAIMLVAVPAAQALYVKGHQVPAGGLKYKMTGGLNGKWKITAFHVKHERAHLLKINGRERFNGCVDVARDGSCSGDPAGKLYFRFRYWVQLSDDGENQLLGTCAHRVVGGTDGLAGTTGFLMMVDTPTRSGLKTHYEGEIEPPGFAHSGTAQPPRC
ncbi:MAG: hypothetical protein ACHQJ5_01230 [Vicinamibacteria bacterium]|jgi:hypothetical protein